MVLVDSNLWIHESRGILSVHDYTRDEPQAVCPPIMQEVLQGSRSRKAEQLMRAALSTARMLEDPMPLDLFEEAARLFRRCQDRGITPGFADSLIAVCAIRNDVPLLTLDSDFQRIAAIVPLRLFSPS